MILFLLLREHLSNVLVHPWTRVCCCHLLLSQAAAQEISWSSNFFGNNENSGGEALDDGFTFHLGVFDPPAPNNGEPPWLPTTANTEDWASFWVTADVAAYNSTTSNFSQSYEVVSQAEGVSLAGKQAYIWGLNRTGQNAEWILVTNSSWIWPAPGSGGIGGFVTNWTIDGSTAVLGSVDVQGVHMKTVAVSGCAPPFLSAALWQQAHFTEAEILQQEETISGWLADPNDNGRPNLWEYALGTPPRTYHRAEGPEHVLMQFASESYQTISQTVDPATDAIVSAEATSNLVDWVPVAAVVSGETNPALLTFRDLVPVSPADDFRGMRLVVRLP